MHVIPQTWSHLHILISVFPFFGLLIFLGFYLGGLRSGSIGATRTCLILLGLLALLSVPIYLSGEGSIAELSNNPRFSKSMIGTHYIWGSAALVLLIITGIAAWLELWRSRRAERRLRTSLYWVGVPAIVTLGVTVVADEFGWQLNHHELESTVKIPDVSTSQLWSHVHIMLNHVPTAGFVFALAFFVIALVVNSDVLKRGALMLFVICAIAGVPTYVTGTATMWALTQPPMPDISKAVINSHRDMALWTLFGLGFTGAASWLELWRYRYFSQFSKLSLFWIMVFAVITLGIMTETGHRGGLINHPEIRTATDILPTDPDAGISPAIEKLINDKMWFVSWQVVHFFGYCFIFGAVFAVAMRVLGFWKSMSFAAVHRILLLGFLGVLMNVFSGMLMMLADSYRYVVNDYMFAPKMAFIVIGATAVLYFSSSERLWNIKKGEDAPAGAKWVAALVLLAWAGVIVCGRMLAYL